MSVLSGVPKTRPDGSNYVAYGSWGYDGPRWHFADPVTKQDHYFDDEQDYAAILNLARDHGAAVSDLWDFTEPHPEESQVPSEGDGK